MFRVRFNNNNNEKPQFMYLLLKWETHFCPGFIAVYILYIHVIIHSLGFKLGKCYQVANQPINSFDMP